MVRRGGAAMGRVAEDDSGAHFIERTGEGHKWIWNRKYPEEEEGLQRHENEKN